MDTLPATYRPAALCASGRAYSFAVDRHETGRLKVNVNYLASIASDSAPPGIFLRAYILGGFCFVAFCAWFVLRGYAKSGDKDDKK
jgi:hypothetical protein